MLATHAREVSPKIKNATVRFFVFRFDKLNFRLIRRFKNYQAA